MNLHPNDGGPRGTSEGAICANGQLYRPATPVSLPDLGPIGRGASATEAAGREASCEELGR